MSWLIELWTLNGEHYTLTLTTVYLKYFANNHSTHQFVFDGGKKTGRHVEKPSKQRTERTNKLNSHEVPRPGIEPGTTAVKGKRSNH